MEAEAKASRAKRAWRRAHPDLNQGPADLQSAALTTELCTRVLVLHGDRREGEGSPVSGVQWDLVSTYAHAGSRTRVTSMGGLYDAATLRAPTLASQPTAAPPPTSVAGGGGGRPPRGDASTARDPCRSAREALRPYGQGIGPRDCRLKSRRGHGTCEAELKNAKANEQTSRNGRDACPFLRKMDSWLVEPKQQSRRSARWLCWACLGDEAARRHRGDSNPCGQSPMDFESISLATRTQCHSKGHRERDNTRQKIRTDRQRLSAKALRLLLCVSLFAFLGEAPAQRAGPSVK